MLYQAWAGAPANPFRAAGPSSTKLAASSSPAPMVAVTVVVGSASTLAGTTRPIKV